MKPLPPEWLEDSWSAPPCHPLAGPPETLHHPAMTNVLFVCSQNRWRSPTAEQVFATYPGIEVASAGTNNDADTPLTSELVRWADLIFVMEKMHRSKVQRRFKAELKDARLICLDIPDNYRFMDEALVRLLEARVTRHLPG
jgi:predicted protein tyrosine phosphatase